MHFVIDGDFRSWGFWLFEGYNTHGKRKAPRRPMFCQTWYFTPVLNVNANLFDSERTTHKKWRVCRYFGPFLLRFSRLRVPPAYALFTHEQRSKPLCRGFCLGSNWVAPAKAKNQLAKAMRKLGEDQMDRHRRESFAKVDDWPILSSDISYHILCIYNIIYIHMYHRLFWSYKLPKYGGSSTFSSSVINVHRASSPGVRWRVRTAKGFAKAPCEYNHRSHLLCPSQFVRLQAFPTTIPFTWIKMLMMIKKNKKE